MMGRLNRDQGQFVYCFNLEEVVPEDHSVRAIAGAVRGTQAGAALSVALHPSRCHLKPSAGRC